MLTERFYTHQYSFLDKLNSTETEYHTGGYEQGQLPNPSNFDRGGRVNKRKKNQQ